MSLIVTVHSFMRPLSCSVHRYRDLSHFCLALPGYRPLLFRDRRRNRHATKLGHRAKAGGAHFQAGSALDARLLIDDMDPAPVTVDRLDRAPVATHHACAALFRIDIVCWDVIEQVVYL